MRMKDAIMAGVLVLQPLEPRIDAAASAGFKGAVVDWINKGHERIVLDMTHIDFIDSSGLGALISSLKSVGNAGELILCHVSQPVMKVFTLTRMHRIFKIFDSTEQAVSFFEP